MVTAMLDGGIGARMFQIAATYALALDNNDECAFDLNAGSISQDHETSEYRDNILKNVKSLPQGWVAKFYYPERRHDYDPIPYHANMMLRGFFTSEKYFAHRRKEVIELFKNTEIINSIKFDFTNSVSLHVRRGDYLVNASHVCSEDYYKNALAEIDKKTKIDHIYVVSDDIPWCRETFSDKRIVFIENVPDYVDFYIQTLCSHNIIANSTFSRMATFLNENKNKIVIAPAIWFGGSIANEIRDVFLNDWDYI